MLNKLKLLKKSDLYIIILGRVLQIIIMLFSMKLLTTLLSPKEIGNYYIILSILAFFNLVLLNPPGMYFSRHILQWQKSKNLLNALFIFIIWMIIVAIISIPILSIIYNVFNYNDKFDLYILIIYIVSAIIISTLHRNVLYGTNILGYRKQFVVYLISTLLLGLLFSTTIIYFYYNYATGWLFGVVLSEFLMVYIIFKFFIQDNTLELVKIKVILTKEKIKHILTFAIPIAITTFLMWGQNTAYRFIIDYKYSAEILGYIGVGLGVSSAIFGSIEAIIMQYFNPIFLKNILDATKEQRAKAWNDMAKQIVPIYILVALFTIAMSEVLINILVDKKFHNSYIYTMIGVGIEFFRVMTNLLNKISQSEYKTTATIKPYIFGFTISLGVLSLFNFGHNYFMIPVILAFAFFSVFVVMYINMKKILTIKYEINILKIFLFGLPFFSIYLIDISDANILQNFLILSIYGIYFLITIYILNKGKSKYENINYIYRHDKSK